MDYTRHSSNDLQERAGPSLGDRFTPLKSFRSVFKFSVSADHTPQMHEVVHRSSGNPDEPEVLGEAAEQKVIDDIERDYQKMVRTQVVLLSLACTLCAGGCTIFAVVSNAHFYLVPSIVAFVWIAFSVRHRNRLWQLSLGFEAGSLAAAFLPGNPISIVGQVVVHVLFALLCLFWWSSHSFLQSIPGQIQNLSNLKYGVKLA
jgi:hypothetical protein